VKECKRETVINDFHSPLLILVKVKSREMKWAGHITGIRAAASQIGPG
jgi:hypothetical protein